MNRPTREALLVSTAVAGAGLVLAVSAWAAAQLDTTLDLLLRDVTVVAQVPWFYGALSSVTIALWAAIGALALSQALAPGRHRAAMVLLGALALLLCADDAIQLHEPDNGPLSGLPEWPWYLLYAGLGLAVLVLTVRRRTAGLIPLLVSGVLLAVSVVIDVVDAGVVIEDAVKLVGAAALVAVPLAVQLDRLWTGPEALEAVATGEGRACRVANLSR